MRQDMGPLGQIDFLTDPELRESLGHAISHQVRDWLRGLDFLQFTGIGNGTGLLTLPVAPDSGYTWSVKLISAQLNAAGNLSIYPGDINTIAPIGAVTAISNGAATFDCIFRWGSNQCVIKDQRNITIAATATILNWRIMVLQVPTEMQGKLN